MSTDTPTPSPTVIGESDPRLVPSESDDLDPEAVGLEAPLPDPLSDSVLHREFIDRFGSGRDMRVIVSADDAATGVGKTTLALYLAKLWDVWGFSPREKATLDPREFTVRYDDIRPGSVMLLDEAERGLERRRSMSDEVLAVGHDFAMKRYRQIFGILTLPSKDMIDARIADKLCDFWILVQERGKADVFRFGTNEFTGGSYTTKVERIRWPDLDGDPDFRTLENMKVDRVTGETESRYVHRDEVDKIKENFWNKASARRQYDLINAMYESSQDSSSNVDLTQSAIGDIVGMSQANVSKIVNADAFEEFYSGFDDGEASIQA